MVTTIPQLIHVHVYHGLLLFDARQGNIENCDYVGNAYVRYTNSGKANFTSWRIPFCRLHKIKASIHLNIIMDFISLPFAVCHVHRF